MRAPAVPDQSWVTARTGATLTAERDVAALALRRNPQRAHLLVSSLLGKHVPVPAQVVLQAAEDLGALVRDGLGAPAYVLGFAETATALGHGVARVCSPTSGQAPYAHTSRRPAPAGLPELNFEEEHSHAVEQGLAIRDDTLLREAERVLVLVDDELSSGRTAINAIRVLQRRWPRRRYVLASLLDVRSARQRAANVAEVAALGAELVSVSLVDGSVVLPPDLPAVAAALTAGRTAPPASDGSAVPVVTWELTVAAPLTGAYGWSAADESALRASAELSAARLVAPLEPAGSVLILGDEEFLYAGQLLAQALGPAVCTSSTTRSPALAVDEPGYPLRTALCFAATDDPGRAAFAYNVLPSRYADRGPAPGFDSIVLLMDRPPAAHTHSGLVQQLALAARVGVHVVVVGSGTTPGVRPAA